MNSLLWTYFFIAISHLFFNKSNIMSDAISNAIYKLKGTWALCIIHNNYPNKMWLVRNGSPLLIGFDEDYIIVSSENIGFNKYTQKYISIDNHDIIEIQLNNNIIEKCIIKGNNLVSLELSNNKLHDCIIECTNLMYLNLQSNYLTFINLDKCLELILINLFNNRFTNNFNIQKFCNKFKYLCEIELSNNNILFEKTLIDLQECSICLNEYKIFSIFIYCGHIICKNCYKVLNKCPICRANKYNSLSLKFNEYIYIVQFYLHKVYILYQCPFSHELIY